MRWGLIGSGNHYVDLFTDGEDRVWIGVRFTDPHGFGHGVATWFLKAAGAKDGMDVEPCVLDVNSDAGSQYYPAGYSGLASSAMRTQAVTGCATVWRRFSAQKLMEAIATTTHAWHEKHGDEDACCGIIRKDAKPSVSRRGRDLSGGSMGRRSPRIRRGVENEKCEVRVSIRTVHGAGRAMGRKRSDETFYDRKTEECKRAGKVTPEMMRAKARRIWQVRALSFCARIGLDESPDCYKRLDEVLTEVSDSVRILHRLTPVGVAMASAREFDPYKD